jgi:hypothetical protein
MQNNENNAFKCHLHREIFTLDKSITLLTPHNSYMLFQNII